MAKVSAVQRDLKRRRLVKKYADKRAALKAKIMDKDSSPEERFQAVLEMSELPKNSAKERIRNRCAVTGRPRGYHRKFKLCRNMLRQLGSTGQLPGVTKSSW
ncbi:MAG: 30S ribosomal protein S14 [Micavibrio sp.]|nr:30S ribosomal protein S14 [Micavibrio sp.]|tara:strand:+ start:568 stop:873 length:306 start_codon:yes stop_codon:yes gene_type:complete